MQSITMRLILKEPLSTETIRSGYFPIPPRLGGIAGANLDREMLLIEALPETQHRAIGSAELHVVFSAKHAVSGPAIILGNLRLFAEAVPMPHRLNDDILGELPEGVWEDVLRQMVRAAEFAEPLQADFIGEALPDLRIAACEASGWRCNLTGEDIPRTGDLRDYVVPVIPNLFGGTEQAGNLLVALPSLHEPILKGAISFDDDGRLVLIAARLPLGLVQRLRPGFALRQPAPPFEIAPATLRKHRELIFCNPSLRD